MKKIILFLLIPAAIIAAGFWYRRSVVSRPDEKVYVAVEGDGAVVAINPIRRRVASRIDLSLEHDGGRLSFHPHNVQVSPDGKTVWVTANASPHRHAAGFVATAYAHEEGVEPDEVVVIDPRTDAVTKRISIGAGLGLAHVELTPDSSLAYVTAQAQGSVYKINSATFEVAARIPMPPGSEPHGIRIAPDGRTAYIALLKGKVLGMLDLQTEKLTEVALDGSPVQTGVTPDGSLVFATLFDAKALAVYKPATKQLQTLPLPATAKGPVQLYPAPDSRFVYVADQGYYSGAPTGATVFKIDLDRIAWGSNRPSSATAITEIPAGQAPHGVVVSRNGAAVYVTNLLGGDVSIIDAATDREVARIPVGTEPNGISYWSKTTAAKPRAATWRRGNPQAALALVEFSDLQCPACAAYHPLVKRLIEEFSGRMRFEYRHFPLGQIHEHAELAARAAEAAGRQGKFWEMEDMLFSRQELWAHATDAEATFSAYAGELGLDRERFSRDLNDPSVAAKVGADAEEGTRQGVSATPTFFLNGQKLQNPRSYEEFKRLVEASMP